MRGNFVDLWVNYIEAQISLKNFNVLFLRGRFSLCMFTTQL